MQLIGDDWYPDDPVSQQQEGVEGPFGTGPIRQPQFWRDEDGNGGDFYIDMQGRKFRTLAGLNRINGTNYTGGDVSQQSFSLNRGNGGHGSWFDQQGTEIMGNLLYAGAGYVGGPLATAMLSYGADDSAESRRDMRAAGAGSLAASVSGGTSTDGSNVSDAGTTDYGATSNASNASTNDYGSSGTTQTGTAGGSTDNYFGDYITDPETGDVTTANGTTDYSNYDSSDYRADNPDQFSNDPDYQQLAQKYGPTIARQILARSGGKPTLGQSILGQVGSDPLSAGFSALPFILALNEANRQGGDINNTIGRMRTLEDSVSGNASPYMTALLDPYDMQTGTGRTALMQDQALRGVRGSSFGDQSLDNYDYTRGVGRADIGSRALMGAAGLQGNLLNSELGAINARNTNRDLLLGAGLNASGRLFQPEKDPFNLNTLLGL